MQIKKTCLAAAVAAAIPAVVITFGCELRADTVIRYDTWPAAGTVVTNNRHARYPRHAAEHAGLVFVPDWPR